MGWSSDHYKVMLRDQKGDIWNLNFPRYYAQASREGALIQDSAWEPRGKQDVCTWAPDGSASEETFRDRDVSGLKSRFVFFPGNIKRSVFPYRRLSGVLIDQSWQLHMLNKEKHQHDVFLLHYLWWLAWRGDGPGGNPSPGTLYQTNRCFTPESFCLPSLIIHPFSRYVTFMLGSVCSVQASQVCACLSRTNFMFYLWSHAGPPARTGAVNAWDELRCELWVIVFFE